MQKSNNGAGVSFLYVFITLLAVVVTWLIHEFAHWCTGEILENQMIMTLNTSYPVLGKYQHVWHEHLISAAGPIITLSQALVAYCLMRRNSSIYVFPFLLTCLYMRTLAGIMNMINLNDEGRISNATGLGSFTIPFVIFGILFYLVYRIVQERKLKARFILITTLLIMLFSSALILSDQFFKIILIH